MRVARRVHRDVHSSRRTPRQPHETMKNARMTGCDACATMNLYLWRTRFPSRARLTLHRCTRRVAVSYETRVHAVFFSSASLLPNHAISFHDQNLRIIHYTRVCVYIYMDIARWILHVVVTTNPRLPIQPVYEKAEFNAGLRVPALNKLDTVILKERRTNHGGLIFSRSRFRLATQPHLPLL